MQCPECQHNNPASARFCSGCGAALAASCTQCGHGNPPEARFCNQCGAALTPAPDTAPERPAGAVAQRQGYTPQHLRERVLTSRSALEGERKRVTVLFADIKGSTELASQLDDEAWHAILDRFFEILTRGVHRFDGTVNQYTGDGIMALFGAPVAHEDHALRACRAALDMQRELRAYADSLRVSRGLNLSMRMGLNSGEVVVGKIGDDLRMDYTAQGHTVNLAARMEQIAEAGRICLTRYTAQLVEGYFRLRDLGAMPVKGVAEPVPVYELEGPGALRTRLELSEARGLSRFVGRERELQALAEAQAAAAAGSGRCVAVVGEAGIGKSRLCHEFADRCRAREVAVYSGFAVPYAAALPMHPVLTLARSYFDIDEREAPAQQRRKIAGALALEGIHDADTLALLFDALDVAEPGAPPPVVDPELCRERFFTVLIRLLLAGDAPSLLLLEDLHWADAPSLAFAEQLTAALGDARTLLLVNYRPWEAPEWLTAATALPLEALSEAEIGELLRDLLGDNPDLRPLGQRLCRQAAGNPLFVEEAVRSLAEQGYLRGAPGAYELVGDIPETVLPDSVQGILAARIDRLDDEAKAALEHAAVIGKDFNRTLLARLLEGSLSSARDTIDDLLDRLVTTGFLVRLAAPGDFRFSHPLTQEVAYRSQLATRRADIHSRLAAMLEAEVGHGVADERALLLAHHWRCAGEPLKAAQWTLDAARTEVLTRESSTAMERFQEAASLADAAPAGAGRDRIAAQARAGIVRTASLLDVSADITTRAFREGLALADGIGDDSTRAELLIAHGALALQQGDAERAVSEVREALETARRIGQPELGARFRIPILLAHFCSGRIQEGIDTLNEAGEPPWHEGPITEENFLSRAFRGLMLTWLGRLREARQELQQAIAVEVRADRSVSWMHANLSEVARLRGEVDVALREARRAVARAEETGAPFFRTFAWRTLAMAQGANGDWPEALRLLEAHRDNFGRGAAAHHFEGLYLANLAEIHLMLGDEAESLAAGERALASAEGAGARTWACQAHWQLARTHAHAGRVQAAEAHLDALQSLVAQTGASLFKPMMLTVRAALSTAEARAALLEQAAEAWRAMGAPAQAETLLEAACAGGQDGDETASQAPGARPAHQGQPITD